MAERKLRLLCLDGGGVRGLSSLYLLQQVMRAVNPTNPPKPCNFFDMIGGTSTGGLIAIMLGRLEMSIEDCIKAYISMSDRIFVKKRHRLRYNTDIQGRFDTNELERSIKQIISDASLPEETTMRSQQQIQGGRRFCKVFVCSIMGENKSVVQFTNYPRDFEANPDLYNVAKIWEVARATSAASTFFDPVKIGPNKQLFVDGATGTNNPVRQLWDEASKLWDPDGLLPLHNQIQCLVSIGTGVPSVEAFGTNLLSIAKTLEKIATETEETAESFARERRNDIISKNRYLRLNVAHGLENVGLEESDKRSDIAAATQRYGELNDTVAKLRTFRNCVNESQSGGSAQLSTDKVLTDEINAPPMMSSQASSSSAFLSLDDSSHYLKERTGDRYWGHLTKASLDIYEQIYEDCKSADGTVRFANFVRQFNGRYPPQRKVEEVWQRLAPLSTSLSKNNALSAIYMIHVENYLHNTMPRSEVASPDGRIVFSRQRKERILAHFGDWVECACGTCGRKWNFAVGPEGMQKNVNPLKKCKVDAWQKASWATRWARKDGAAAYDDNRVKWMGISR